MYSSEHRGLQCFWKVFGLLSSSSVHSYNLLRFWSSSLFSKPMCSDAPLYSDVFLVSLELLYISWEFSLHAIALPSCNQTRETVYWVRFNIFLLSLHSIFLSTDLQSVKICQWIVTLSSAILIWVLPVWRSVFPFLLFLLKCCLLAGSNVIAASAIKIN